MFSAIVNATRLDPYRGLAIAVLMRAAKDLLVYEYCPKERQRVENDILKGGLDIWFAMLDMEMAPQKFIDSVYSNRNDIERVEIA